MAATNDLENIGDIIETNLVTLGGRRIELGLRISEATREVMREFHASVMRAFDSALLTVTQRNEAAARPVIEGKSDIHRLADSAALHGAERLVADAPDREETCSMEMHILENFNRVYYFTKRICRVLIPSAAKRDEAA